MKKILGKSVTQKIRPLGHGVKNLLASMWYGFPAKKLKIIGITGTKGKTTTTTISGRLANLAGIKSGYITTAVINTGSIEGEFLNPFKMTSIDGVTTQKYLAEMVKNRCEWVFMEMSSQGLEQNRHWGLFGFDEVVFLNLYPEHIEAHGSYEKYKQAKGILFSKVKKGGVFIGNSDFEESEYMWNIVPNGLKSSVAKKLIGFNDFNILPKTDSLFQNIVINDQVFPTNFTAKFDILNCYFAITEVVSLLNHRNEKPQKSTTKMLAAHLENIYEVPGRMEWVVRDGQVLNTKSAKIDNPNISILVDYAHEPESMKQLLETLTIWKEKGYFENIIHIVSCDGVGRDDWKKPILGQISKKFADYSILTTDNYDEQDNPEDITNLLSKSLDPSYLNQAYFCFSDRKQALEKSIEIAKHSGLKTIIVSTGVGSEQGLTQPGGKIWWDEREVWRSLFTQ